MLVVITSTDPESTIFNFVALNVITDFDDLAYESLQSTVIKELMECSVFVISRTTSVNCNPDELAYYKNKKGEVLPILDKHENHLTIRVNFMGRSLGNKICYFIYKIMRIMYTAGYFYFCPFFCLIFSVLMPNLIYKS